MYETHSHTELCGHAWGEPEEYARTAAARGLKGIVFTCHNPMPEGFGAGLRMRRDQFPVYLDLVARAREALDGTADVRLGLECDYYPGAEGWLERQAASAPFDYLLGSVHPHVAEYRRMFFNGSMADFQVLYFEHLALAAETGLFDCLAHPDLIKNLAPDEWEPRAIHKHICESLDRIAATGIAMELNTSGAFKEFPEMNPGPLILREMKARDVPVVVGADAHTPDRAGDRFLEALDLLSETGYDRVNIFLNRQRLPVGIDEMRARLENSRGRATASGRIGAAANAG